MDQVAQIRDRIDIVSFIGEYIPVSKAGKNFKALCPFHGEKSPSFIISPDRQRWHCFGCAKGGDCYAFLMEYERMEFPEALRFLAARAGITLESFKGDSTAPSQKEQIYKVNGLVKEYYHYVLTKLSVGKAALEYLKNRGISDKVIETFCIGFAPATGISLTNYLIQKKQYPKEDLLAAGLIVDGGNRLYDFFRGRLMFPLIDHRDNVVGFSGRILEKNDNISKYVNTRETLVYHKGEHFFGLNITKDSIRRENQAIIVEGEFDVISCFQHGIGNMVGVKGTALTDNHVNLLSRYAQKITFCFDGDKAGQEAIKRSLPVVEKKGLTPTVIEVPGGKDPDEALQTEQALFKKAVREDQGIYDYLFAKTFADNDITTVEGKKYVSDTLLPFIANIKNEIIKEHYIRKISNDLQTSYESIAKEMQRLQQKELRPRPIVTVPKTKRPQEEILEEYLLAVIVQGNQPQKLVRAAFTFLADVLVPERACQKILSHLSTHFAKTPSFESKSFGDSLPTELVECYDTCLLLPLPVFESDDKVQGEVEKIAQKLQGLYIQQKIKQLSLAIQEKEAAGEDVESLQKEYSTLVSQLDKS